MAARALIFAILALALSACTSEGGTDGPRCNAMNPTACGTGGSGGEAGIGGNGGTGVGGAGGTVEPACETSALCLACPEQETVCESEGDCGDGYACITSGCATIEGGPIRYCVLEPAGFCETQDDCAEGRVCTDLGDEGSRCVKTAPGCGSDAECIPGFLCESEVCVDRRVPCIFDEDCPMSFVCETFGAATYCVRVHQDCEVELDCAGIAPRCEDIDGDGRKECAAPFDPNAASPTACINSDCVDPARPVCEASDDLRSAVCGQFGLCLTGDDCAEGFDCVLSWPDGRSECVPGGDCTSSAECDERQVCASSRVGGRALCQSGIPSP